ncbi:MAG: Carnitine operon protein CaiE [Alphaproteobacteria bacterium MarineAlpha4_Bin2]|nr:MAG: Carnitine operon protein CaiE [Alphaproteobacteria bacterium MarineAlpha4_Bin2]
MATIVEFEGKTPQIHSSVFVASTAVIIGDVVLEEGASVWYGAVLRGDSGIIRVGKESNVQDNVVIHADTEHGTIIRERVTLGHGCILHDTHIGDGCVVGMLATLLHRSVVGKRSMIGAGAVVREGFEVPSYSVAAGVPAKVMKALDGSAKEWLDIAYEEYTDLSERYKKGARIISD